MRRTLQLSALCALLHCIAPSLALTTETIYGPSETDGYMFYDATDECKNTTEPCITNFKHCSNLESDDNMRYACPAGAKLDKSSDWIYLTGSQVFWWADTINEPIPMFDTTRHAVSNYTLRWANTNPKYNTTVYLVPMPAESYNEFGLTFEADFRLKTVIPAGQTEFNFQFFDMLERMVPEYYDLDPHDQDLRSLMNEMKYTMVTAWNVAFAIGQPDDPKYRDPYGFIDLGNNNLNVTATSSPFRWSTVLVRDLITTKQNDEEAKDKALKKKEDKWQLGVGIGVGLGIPIVAVVMFALGMLLGKRSERKNGANINLVDVPKAPEEN